MPILSAFLDSSRQGFFYQNISGIENYYSVMSYKNKLNFDWKMFAPAPQWVNATPFGVRRPTQNLGTASVRPNGGQTGPRNLLGKLKGASSLSVRCYYFGAVRIWLTLLDAIALDAFDSVYSQVYITHTECS